MTKKQAWKQTFRKWEALIENPQLTIFCGLCDYAEGYCTDCPISEFSNRLGRWHCNSGTPHELFVNHRTIKNAELEYLFLLLVYEATKGDK